MSLDWLHLGIPYGWLVVPLAITIISAVAQVVAKLRALKVLNELRADLDVARLRHRSLLTEYFLRQHFLCRQLELAPPDRPASTLPPRAGAEEGGKSRWSRWLLDKLPWRKPKTTLTEGSTGSARAIVGRHSLSVGSSLVWRTAGANIMRAAQPLGVRVIQPVGSRVITVAPRLFTLGGGAASTGGSVAAGTAARAVIGAVSVVGWVIGPALAGWTVYSELRKIKKARRELAILLGQQDRELAGFRVKNRRLEAQYAKSLETPVGRRELVPTAG